MKDYLSAFMIGISFSNMWICALLIFSLQQLKKNVCIGYLSGRIITTILMSIMVSFIGRAINFNTGILQIISGIIIITFSICMIFRFAFPKTIKKNINDDSTHATCINDCNTCSVKKINSFKNYCYNCQDNQLSCLAENTEIEYLNSIEKNNKYLNTIFGIILGSIKGVIFCGKFLIIAPIMFSATVLNSLIIGIIFSISSSIYPVLGFIFGSAILKVIKFRRIIFVSSGIAVVLIGVRYIFSGIALFL